MKCVMMVPAGRRTLSAAREEDEFDGCSLQFVLMFDSEDVVAATGN